MAHELGREETDMKTIILGYDGTEGSERALARTTELASAFGSKVVVTSVAHRLTATAHGGGSVDPTDLPGDHDALLDAARNRLAGGGIDVDTVLGVGDAAEAIVQLAEERAADLIVVGTREPSFVERVLGHSVSESVQRRAHCDVLIVH
jgi:nucleotide-binding universal stress UspA family protein